MDNLISLYQEYLQLEEAVFSRIDHAEAMVAIVYKITQPGKEPYILKICDRSNDYLREAYFLKHFEGILAVPKIIQLVEPDKNKHGAILMECLPGHLLESEKLTEALAYEIGQSLALIHHQRLIGYGDPVQPELNFDPSIYFTSKFEEGIEECKNYLPADLIEKCHYYYENNRALLSSVDGPCIAHRDFRPGNLIVNEGRLQGVIDWAGARASFAEEDFCAIEHEKWLRDKVIKNSFLKGYAAIRPIPKYEPLISFLRLNKTLATLGFTIKRGTWATTHARLYQYNRRFLETFF